jgi:hypothetical protein
VSVMRNTEGQGLLISLWDSEKSARAGIESHFSTSKSASSSRSTSSSQGARTTRSSSPSSPRECQACSGVRAMR